MNFQPFDHFVFRCPTFPSNITDNFQNKNKIFEEAIFLASPDLYNKISAEINNPRKAKKITIALLKYELRMKNRCTPFGLFAGCGIGKIAEKSYINIDLFNSYQSHTRLDMDFLCELSRQITQMPAINEKLIYYANTTIYKILNSYRYVEYSYKNKKRVHNLSEFEYNPHTEQILNMCTNGTTKKMIFNFLIEEGFDPSEISEYLDSLIRNQIIVSNLELSITEIDPLRSLIEKLNNLNILPTLKSCLIRIQKKLEEIDVLPIGRDKIMYDNIRNEVKSLNIEYESKFLFQSDLSILPKFASLSKKIVADIKIAINILSKISMELPDKNLQKFKEKFSERYEDQEIPLVEALDPDIGIGFSDIFPGNIGFAPLVDSISSLKKEKNNVNFVSSVEQFFIKWYSIFFDEGNKEIILTDSVLNELNSTYSTLPTTFSVIAEIIKADTDTSDSIIHIKGVGGSSAASLLNRFCHTNNMIKQYVNEIINKEDENIGPDKIIAEIIHLPESRTGNILLRPSLRSYEIPYLSRQSVTEEFTISITDLLISVKKGNRLQLKSRRLNKEIIPRLTTAHNFSYNALPIYHFLCSLQFNELKASQSFNWGHFLGSRKFLPRVSYKNIILSPALWNIKREELVSLQKSTNIISDIIAFKTGKNLPDLVLLRNGDNKLLIDFKDKNSISFILEVGNLTDITLEEFIFSDENPLVTSGKFMFRNEIIIGFYNTEQT